MSRQLLRDCVLLDPEAVAPFRGSVLVEDGVIRAVTTGLPGDLGQADIVDLRGHFLAPGFIDLHHHGELIFATGPEVITAALQRDSLALARHGTTALLATTVAWPGERLDAAMTQIETAMTQAAWPGAEVLGVHLEGPWINPAAAGAQPAPSIRPYDAAEDGELLEKHREILKMVTLAPECDGASALLDRLVRGGQVAALGHSHASQEQIDAAVARGLTHVTHLFNAMGPMHHREPGVAGSVLADERLSCDLICDGVHVHPRMLSLAARVLGQRLVLITDRVTPPKAGNGSFGSGALLDDGHALRLSDGRLAGSSLTLDRAIRGACEFAGLSLLEAVAAATLRPARVLGIESQRGTLRVGARADFAVLDHEGAVIETWLAGRRLPQALEAPTV